MRVYSVLLAVTIAFLANSAAVAANPDKAKVSKLLRGENADRRRLTIGLDLAEDISEIGERVGEVMRTNAHLKKEMAKWCAEVVKDLEDLKHKGLETGKMRHSSKKNDRPSELETLYKDYMMAKVLAQKKIKCDESE